MELLSVVPFLCAIPALFHELAMSSLLHSHSRGGRSVPSERPNFTGRRDSAVHDLPACGIRYDTLHRSEGRELGHQRGILCLIIMQLCCLS